MVESKSEHDVLKHEAIAVVGDDTGLIKKVQINAKCTQISHSIAYGAASRANKRKKQNESSE